MPISVEEQKDLDEMQAKISQIKQDCVNVQLTISLLSKTQLKASGFKFHADGYVYKIKMAQAKINDLEKAFLRKWPDK